MDYNQLKAEIASWAARGDLPIDTLIVNAEATLNRVVRHRDMERHAVVSFDNAGTADLPPGVLEPRTLVLNSLPRVHPEFVQPDSPAFLFRHRPYAMPQYAALVGDTLRVRPAMETTGAFDYYERIPALSDENPTNWLLERDPDVYLFAALMDAAAYTHDEEALALYLGRLEGAVSGLREDGRAARLGREPPPPYPPGARNEAGT